MLTGRCWHPRHLCVHQSMASSWRRFRTILAVAGRAHRTAFTAQHSDSRVLDQLIYKVENRLPNAHTVLTNRVAHGHLSLLILQGNTLLPF